MVSLWRCNFVDVAHVAGPHARMATKDFDAAALF
jgi:hypothetical protein